MIVKRVCLRAKDCRLFVCWRVYRMGKVVRMRCPVAERKRNDRLFTTGAMGSQMRDTAGKRRETRKALLAPEAMAAGCGRHRTKAGRLRLRPRAEQSCLVELLVVERSAPLDRVADDRVGRETVRSSEVEQRLDVDGGGESKEMIGPCLSQIEGETGRCTGRQSGAHTHTHTPVVVGCRRGPSKGAGKKKAGNERV